MYVFEADRTIRRDRCRLCGRCRAVTGCGRVYRKFCSRDMRLAEDSHWRPVERPGAWVQTYSPSPLAARDKYRPMGQPRATE